MLAAATTAPTPVPPPVTGGGLVRLGKRFASAAGARTAELAIIAAAVALRISMIATFPPEAGYDFVNHWGYIEWVARHWTLPPLTLNFSAYGCPLYYVLAALFRAAGWGPWEVRALTFVFAGARLLLLAAALEQFLPDRRRVRLVALGLAALLPTSVHMDGMVTNESLSTVLSLAALVAMPGLLRPGRRPRQALLAGTLLGLAILTKTSGLMLAVALSAALAVQIARQRRTVRSTLRQQGANVALALAVAMTMSAWFFVRNQVLYGKALVTTYDIGPAAPTQARFLKIPYLDRRMLGYYVGWSNAVFADPYFPNLEGTPPSRFWPVLVATTFVDFYDYGFAPAPLPGRHGVQKHGPAITHPAFGLSRWSMAGGTVVALVTLLALLASVRRLWRMDDARLVLLLVPIFAVVGQLHFATEYPDDGMGPVKGLYLQFAAGPLFALFGVGVDWLWRRSRAGRALALTVVAPAGACVAAYVLYCRLWPFLR